MAAPPLWLERPFGRGSPGVPCRRVGTQRGSLFLRDSASRAERRLRSESVSAVPGTASGPLVPSSIAPTAATHRRGESPNRARRPQEKRSQTSGVSQGFRLGSHMDSGEVCLAVGEGFFLQTERLIPVRVVEFQARTYQAQVSFRSFP